MLPFTSAQKHGAGLCVDTDTSSTVHRCEWALMLGLCGLFACRVALKTQSLFEAGPGMTTIVMGGSEVSRNLPEAIHTSEPGSDRGLSDLSVQLLTASPSGS